MIGRLFSFQRTSRYKYLTCHSAISDLL